MRTNWIKQTIGEIQPTVEDKLKALLRVPYKLVLVQQHELEKLRARNKKNDYDIRFIESLYIHYIVEGKGKTYLY
jgi:hypothetical protein